MRGICFLGPRVTRQIHPPAAGVPDTQISTPASARPPASARAPARPTKASLAQSSLRPVTRSQSGSLLVRGRHLVTPASARASSITTSHGRDIPSTLLRLVQPDRRLVRPLLPLPEPALRSNITAPIVLPRSTTRWSTILHRSARSDARHSMDSSTSHKNSLLPPRRTASPYPDKHVVGGPQLLTRNSTNNYHSSSLATLNKMVSSPNPSVNRTGKSSSGSHGVPSRH